MAATDKSPKEAGKKLRELRKSTGLSLFKVAKRLNISGNYLSQIERGEKIPSDIVLHSIAEFYNLDKDYLFGMYNKIIPDEINHLVNVPELRKVITKISTDKKLSEEDRLHIANELYNLYNKMINKKGL